MKRWMIGMMVGTMFAGMGALSHAALISGPFASTTIPSTRTDWTGTLSFPKFDGSLGILQQVTLQVSGTLSTRLTVQNLASSPSQGTVRTELMLFVQDSGNHLNYYPDPVVDIVSSAFAYSLAPGGSLTSGVLTKSGSDTSSYTDPTILAEFWGPGTIVLDAHTFTQTLLANNGGNTSADQVTFANASGWVTYEYIIPEPDCLPLLALVVAGGVAFEGLRRKKKIAS